LSDSIRRQPDDWPLPQLPKRNPDSHKGDFGLALIIGGSRNMSGAVALCGMAALRSGAGLVRLAVPDAAQPMVAAHEPSYMTVPLASDEQGQLAVLFFQSMRPRSGVVELESLLSPANALACGPGLGKSDSIDRFVAWIYAQSPQPAVFDADALNALARQPNALGHHDGVRILTPHPGEFSRLLGESTPTDADGRRRLAEKFAADTKTIVVLKGNRTIVTDGERTVQNTTGNPGLATGGTGDVLTGVLTALLAQGMEPFEASRLAVYVHGLAGDFVATELGRVGMIASDVAHALPQAFRELGP